MPVASRVLFLSLHLDKYYVLNSAVEMSLASASGTLFADPLTLVD